MHSEIHPALPPGDHDLPWLELLDALYALVESGGASRETLPWHSLAKRLCKGVARVEWCNPDQLGKVIAAMQIDADRRARRAAAQ